MLRRLQFELWYLFHPPWDSGISPPELGEFIASHASGRALDLGCGSGTNAITLALHGWQVTAIDFSANAIRIARRKALAAGVNIDFSVADVTAARPMGTFDFALDLGCFHGITDREAYLRYLDACLMPGGYWLMYGFFKPSATDGGPGLEQASLDLIRSHAYLLRSRTDGYDRRTRPSAWFLYQRPA